MNLNDLKQENRLAHAALIEMWAELSRVSKPTAKRYLIEDMGFRYVIEKKGGILIFKDGHAGDTFVFDASAGCWNLV